MAVLLVVHGTAFQSLPHNVKAALRLDTLFGFRVAMILFPGGLFVLVAKLLFWKRLGADCSPMMIAPLFLDDEITVLLDFREEYVTAINAPW